MFLQKGTHTHTMKVQQLKAKQLLPYLLLEQASSPSAK